MSNYRGGNSQLDFGAIPKQPSYRSNINHNNTTKHKLPSFLQTENEKFNQYLTKFDKFTDKFEVVYDFPLIKKIRPYTPVLARFFIVATFFEDSLRIFNQWSDQVFYLWHYRHIPYFLSFTFLLLISLTMLVGSCLLVIKKKLMYASIALMGTVILQALVYGSVSGIAFVLRNISVVGGLLIAIGDSIVTSQSVFGMLPELSDRTQDRKSLMLLTGRILVVVMFLSFTVAKNFVTTILVLFGTLLIAIGYRTRFASILLLTILFFYNITINNYWFYKRGKRDMLKYEFYQNMSIMGGLLLAVNTGAGQHSLDEKKKIY
ncbi:SURF4-domain-containing protein [Hanseniaspora valbyensis NRRL Y-1626]|uniref:SURF4-domain-containing protein n=1 Tax=Hanseniaspora valbyensis NRRL Y-1626 TaxID=766949 RepID=A0A1B7TGP1_9ASCO|nr:SURF4-domain-containing protein [Hanseniaspora valbyensis NRRL Y-1626]